MIYTLLHRLTIRGHRPIPERPGLDGAKGVRHHRVKQLHRIAPCWQENLLSDVIFYSVMLPSSAQDFSDVTLAYKESAQESFDVTLAYEESAYEFFDVTLAREDNRPGVLATT